MDDKYLKNTVFNSSNKIPNLSKTNTASKQADLFLKNSSLELRFISKVLNQKGKHISFLWKEKEEKKIYNMCVLKTDFCEKEFQPVTTLASFIVLT